MRRIVYIWAGILACCPAGPAALRAVAAPPQAARVVDRIVARIEGDIILQSQLRELAAFQQLIEGRAESDEQLLKELIEQWIIQTEATTTQYPHPPDSEVELEASRVAAQFKSPELYAARLAELQLSAAEVRQLLARQLYVERYLDYKFRPTLQIEPAEIDAYYQQELLPGLAAKKQAAPARADVEAQIRELLTQRKITELASKWLDDTKSRLRIELNLKPERAGPHATPPEGS